MSAWESSPPKWLGMIATCAVAAVVGFVVVQRGLGFLLVFVAPVVALWAAWALYATRHWYDGRRLAWKKIGVWVFVLGACGFAHWRYAVNAREAGDAIARAVAHYQETTGRYPDSLADAGVDPALARRGRLVYAKGPNGFPQLAYMATFEMMSSYSYDFQARRWDFNPD